MIKFIAITVLLGFTGCKLLPDNRFEDSALQSTKDEIEVIDVKQCGNVIWALMDMGLFFKAKGKYFAVLHEGGKYDPPGELARYTGYSKLFCNDQNDVTLVFYGRSGKEYHQDLDVMTRLGIKETIKTGKPTGHYIQEITLSDGDISKQFAKIFEKTNIQK